MQYQNVCLEALAYTLPEEIVTSEQLEARLEPLYRRLHLPEGRLELMTGIRQRRQWPPGIAPSRKSIETAEKAILASGIDRRQLGALVHGSVSRDYLEPATACGVHHGLGLPRTCTVYDVSNACLGLLNGMVQVADMIELGRIRAGLVVGTENARPLVETTIERLNSDTSLSRRDIKLAVASLTIGSGSAAVLLCDRRLSRTGNRLLGGIARANTRQCHLCRGRDETVGDLIGPLMWTDSETLLKEGVATARDAFAEFLDEMGWTAGDVQKTFCHQVGRAHQKLLFESLGLDPAIDFTTLEFLGNTGSVALPMTAAIGMERGHLEKDDRVAFLGIGSGINVLMLGVQWRVRAPVIDAGLEDTDAERVMDVDEVRRHSGLG
jgi:3-oxoacyl-[acyl-carrier-protein] synthase III